MRKPQGRAIPLSAKNVHDERRCQQPRQLGCGGYEDVPEVPLRQYELPVRAAAVPAALRMQLHGPWSDCKSRFTASMCSTGMHDLEPDWNV